MDEVSYVTSRATPSVCLELPSGTRHARFPQGNGFRFFAFSSIITGECRQDSEAGVDG